MLLEPHIENTVHFVDYQDFEGAAVESTRLVEMLEKTPGRSDYDVHVFDVVSFDFKIFASDYERAAKIMQARKRPQHFENLNAELSRWYEDEGS